MSTASTATEHSNSGTQEQCPRCHSLRPWGENSWCPDCGYYPMVDRGATDGSSWADSLPDLPEEETDDHRTALESIPGWFWAMIGVSMAITVISAAVRLTLPTEDDIPVRGTIALVQLTIGLISMLTAHLMAAKYALSNDRRLNAGDIVLSWFNIWQPTIISLPETCKRIWAMVWGGVAVITAVTIIGGIDYSAPFRTEREAPKLKPLSVIGAVANAAKAQAAANGDQPQSLDEAFADLQSQTQEMVNQNGGGSGKSMEEAFAELGDVDRMLEQSTGVLNEMGGAAGVAAMTAEEMAAKLAATREKATLNCYVYGVIANKQSVPVALLFAANTRGEEQHVAQILGKDIDRDLYRTIVMRLYNAVQPNPEIPTERKAIWVKPIVTCRLNFEKITDEGELENAKIEAIIVDQKGRYDSGSDADSPRRTQRR
ncbi:MAG: hypothetical protein R3C49_03345 [Planctomycetaceae bacterium]